MKTDKKTMKKVAITAAVTAVLVIVCVFCFWRWEQVRELLREDFVESMLPGGSGESATTAQTPYFFDYGTETVEFEAGFAGTLPEEYEQAKIQVEQVAQGENGILYTLMIESDAEADGRYSYGGDRFFCNLLEYLTQ